MGIEPTERASPHVPPVLKTGPRTSQGRATAVEGTGVLPVGPAESHGAVGRGRAGHRQRVDAGDGGPQVDHARERAARGGRGDGGRAHALHLAGLLASRDVHAPVPGGGGEVLLAVGERARVGPGGDSAVVVDRVRERARRRAVPAQHQEVAVHSHRLVRVARRGERGAGGPGETCARGRRGRDLHAVERGEAAIGAADGVDALAVGHRREAAARGDGRVRRRGG